MRLKDKNNIEICREEFSKTKLQNLLIDNTYRDLQKAYGFNERIFSQLAKEYGIKKDYQVIRKKCKRLDIDEKEVIHLYDECKYSLRRIASLYNTTHKTIKNILVKNGCQIRSRCSAEYYLYQPGICNRGYRGTTDYYHIDGNGYVCLYVDGRLMREHRYVMEQHLGRQLSSDEYVHHIDFNRLNNAVTNLCVMERDEHCKLHRELKTVEDYKKYSQQYKVSYDTVIKNHEYNKKHYKWKKTA